ncbi:MAG: trimeric intracellular cation channel family protein [Ruminococcaceae bacterium]|nr:trimeric intracellular cation channel family protein [Oscillospiraceae bacterium]
MGTTELFILITDIIGTAAFAVSGALAGVRKRMDIFGVNILAILTATGGGIIRDLIIGYTPPMAFRNPFFVILAAIAANITFAFLYWQHRSGRKMPDKAKNIYDKVFFWCDTIGLAAFTIDGVHTGFFTSFSNNWFLVIFLGVVTGVGGGVMRDVLSLEMPYIFVKHIYAIASIIGATATYLIFLGTDSAASAMLAGFLIVIGIRYLAARFRWNLPKVDN